MLRTTQVPHSLDHSSPIASGDLDEARATETIPGKEKSSSNLADPDDSQL